MYYIANVLKYFILNHILKTTEVILKLHAKAVQLNAFNINLNYNTVFLIANNIQLSVRKHYIQLTLRCIKVCYFHNKYSF